MSGMLNGVFLSVAVMFGATAALANNPVSDAVDKRLKRESAEFARSSSGQNEGAEIFLERHRAEVLEMIKQQAQEQVRNYARRSYEESQADAIRQEILNNGRFEIFSNVSGKCMDVRAQDAFTPGPNVQQWDCNGGAQQEWSLRAAGPNVFEIVNQRSNFCLDAEANSLGQEGIPMQTYPCSGANNQRFRFIEAGRGNQNPYLIQVVARRTSDKCVDLTAGSSQNGQYLQHYSCLNNSQNTNQRWVIRLK